MSGYIGTAPVPQAVQRRENFTATAGQASFATVGYTVGFVDVFLNGIHLLGDGTDYTASNSSDIVLTAGASAGDVVEVISFETFDVASQTFTGTTTVTKSSGAPLVANRQVDDGSIIDLRKNGSTAGIIGSNTSGSRLHIGKDNVALSFAAGGANAIIPWDSTANAVEDAALSLGGSTARFKDLYLSGGVYLGGTGSANKLDDYEEGTWSPVFSDATSGGNTATANGGKRGLYTKIGNQVTVSCASTNLDTTGMTGANDLYIQGLPFTPTSYVSPNHYWTGGTRLGVVSFNTNGFVTAYVSDAVTYVRLGETISGSSIDNIICSQLTSGSADISFTITYHTDA